MLSIFLYFVAEFLMETQMQMQRADLFDHICQLSAQA